MKTKTYITHLLIVVPVAILVMGSLVGFEPFVYLNSSEVPHTTLWADNSTGPVQLAQYDVSGKFDRTSCELNCRSSYKHDWNSDSPMYYGCIQKCSNQAWSDFFGNKKKDDYTVR